MNIVREQKQLENFFKADYPLNNNEWGIPDVMPFNDNIDDIEWIPFWAIHKFRHKLNAIGVHFFIHDYQFNQVWNRPDKYLNELKRCRAVCAPDFSQFTDMPKAMRLWQAYKKQWLTRYWQDYGINVIPTITWNLGDIEEFSLAGMPQQSILARGFACGGEHTTILNDLNEICKRLNPSKLLFKCSKTQTEKILKHFPSAIFITHENWSGAF